MSNHYEPSSIINNIHWPSLNLHIFPRNDTKIWWSRKKVLSCSSSKAWRKMSCWPWSAIPTTCALDMFRSCLFGGVLRGTLKSSNYIQLIEEGTSFHPINWTKPPIEWNFHFNWSLSGKLRVCCRKAPFWVSKSTNYPWPCLIAMFNWQRVCPVCFRLQLSERVIYWDFMGITLESNIIQPTRGAVEVTNEP